MTTFLPPNGAVLVARVFRPLKEARSDLQTNT